MSYEISVRGHQNQTFDARIVVDGGSKKKEHKKRPIMAGGFGNVIGVIEQT
jgi:hypothetical protein